MLQPSKSVPGMGFLPFAVGAAVAGASPVLGGAIISGWGLKKGYDTYTYDPGNPRPIPPSIGAPRSQAEMLTWTPSDAYLQGRLAQQQVILNAAADAGVLPQDTFWKNLSLAGKGAGLGFLLGAAAITYLVVRK